MVGVKFNTRQLSVVAHAFNLSTQKSEAGGSLWIPRQPGLQSEFQDRQSYIHSKTPSKKKKNQLLIRAEWVPAPRWKRDHSSSGLVVGDQNACDRCVSHHIMVFWFPSHSHDINRASFWLSQLLNSGCCLGTFQGPLLERYLPVHWHQHWERPWGPSPCGGVPYFGVVSVTSSVNLVCLKIVLLDAWDVGQTFTCGCVLRTVDSWSKCRACRFSEPERSLPTRKRAVLSRNLITSALPSPLF